MGDLSLMSLVDPKTDQSSMNILNQEISDTHFVKHSMFRALWNMFKNLFCRLPFQVAYYHNSLFTKKLKELLKVQHYDLVYCHLIRMAPYAEICSNAKVILDYTDCISLEYGRRLEHLRGFRKIFFGIEANRTASYELALAHKFDENWVISPVDLRSLGLVEHNKSIIMPNQVPIPKLEADYSFKSRLIFTGNMSVPHNVMAAQNVCRKIMPALLRKYPSLNFTIVGANPSADIMSLNNVNNTAVLGFVDDLYQELRSSDIFIAPLYFSAGIQNKALEAMACGIPVITTPNVAKSLDAQDEVDLMIAEDNLAFVKKTEFLIENAKARKQIGKSGRALVLKKYSREAVINLLHKRIDKLLKQGD